MAMSKHFLDQTRSWRHYSCVPGVLLLANWTTGPKLLCQGNALCITVSEAQSRHSLDQTHKAVMN